MSISSDAYLLQLSEAYFNNKGNMAHTIDSQLLSGVDQLLSAGLGLIRCAQKSIALSVTILFVWRIFHRANQFRLSFAAFLSLTLNPVHQ